MRAFPLLAIFVLPMLLSGCDTIASKTNILSDDKIKSSAGGAIGYEPSEVEILSKRVEGTNTYVVVRTNDKKQFSCIINGGNILTMGMTNPPQCAPKGQGIKAGPSGG